MEYKTYVVPVKFRMSCEECQEGEMMLKYTSGGFNKGESVSDYEFSISYYHRCDKCGYEKAYNKSYPYLDYEDKKE